MNLKKILKTIKLNESTISMVLGAIVLVIVGTLVIKYLKNTPNKNIPSELLDNGSSIEQTSKTYKVESGDNLWKIAVKEYGDGFRWVDIATENKIANASIIEEGQELIIPEVETIEPISETPASEKITTESAKPETISAATYEVAKGDNLWNISVRAYGDGYKWVEIAKENKLENPNLIHPGNILVLPR